MNNEPLKQSPASRYQLTLLFVDLSHSTEISQAMEPEHYLEVMTELRTIWQSVVEQYGGHLVRSQGDGALIVFGYPSSTEQDGRLAAEAALQIHERIEGIRHPFLPRKHLPLRMHSGIHAGTMLLSDGDIERGRFDLIGEIPNTAAHLASAAAPGQILASLAVLGPHANFFVLEPIVWRGNSLPPKDLRAVVGRNNVQSRFDSTKKRGLTPLIGRQSALEQIDQFLAQTISSTNQENPCLVLVGAAGLGKTRLINETLVKHNAHSKTFVYGVCESHTVTEPLHPFSQMLLHYRDQYSLTSLRSHKLPTIGSSSADIVGDYLGFLTSLPEKDSLVIVIDDWQWADNASRQLVGALLTNANCPKILLATRPQDNGEDWIYGAPHISISPLTKEQTIVAVKRWLPHADPFLCESIHTYSGGVPLFIEELCHSASVSDLKKTIVGSNINQSWLGSLVASRLYRLNTDLQYLIRVCAVIGNYIPMWLLEATLGKPPSPETLIELEDADFLYPVVQNGAVNTLLFKHRITRDAVYKVIGLKERADLHQQIYHSIVARQNLAPNAEDFAELMAHHSRGASQWMNAAHFAEISGDKSVAAFAFDLANTQYRASLEALDRIDETDRDQTLLWCKVAGKLALTSIFDPLCLGNDLSIFETAVKKAEYLQDLVVLAQAKYWLGYLQYGLGQLRVSAITVREAISIARQSAMPSLIGPFEATLGQILVASSQYDEGLSLLDKALDARKHRTGKLKGSSAMGVAYSLAIYGFALADRGQFAEAHQRFDEAIDLLAGTTHPVGNSVRNFICVSYIWQEKWAEAEAIALESRKIAENSRTLLQLASSRGLLDYIYWATAKDRNALERFKETLVWMDDHHCSFYTSLYFGFLANACAKEGQIAEARHYALRVAMRRTEGEALGEAMTCRAMAEISSDTGKPALAKRWLTRAEKSANARLSERETAANRLVETLNSI
jgi:class 3 adenylate cyclase/tetratricopeptide (TPR) repeat protein